MEVIIVNIVNICTVLSLIISFGTIIVTRKDKKEYQKKVLEMNRLIDEKNKEYENLLGKQKSEFKSKLHELNKLGKLEKEAPEVIDNINSCLRILNNLREKMDRFEPTKQCITEANIQVTELEKTISPIVSQKILPRTESILEIRSKLNSIERYSLNNANSYLLDKEKITTEISSLELVFKGEITHIHKNLEDVRNKLSDLV
ncbi:hypothetical protein [Sporosarcina ureae]|uniref:Uncharacterized protein n=1 Tax=Sporosarcina ureae TaxID=1571 RepID=A0ABM6JTI8_SPOUR|nr:hypothetical protein [Sporosarcina ureae]ARF13606.1 hypothetical protein SporoS204_05180 [Sporosarcina ureae]